MTTRNHRSIEQLGGTYSLTVTTMGWKHIFIKQKYLNCIINSFLFHQDKKAVYTVGYCIMLSHLHWIIKLNDSFKNISIILGTFKSFIAHEILNGLKAEDNSENFALHPVLSKNSNLVIEKPSALLEYFTKLAHTDVDQNHRFWQRDSDIKLIETYPFLQQKLKYIHQNPIRDNWNIVKNPTEYPYSSARFYEEGTDWHQLKIMNLF